MVFSTTYNETSNGLGIGLGADDGGSISSTSSATVSGSATSPFLSPIKKSNRNPNAGSGVSISGSQSVSSSTSLSGLSSSKYMQQQLLEARGDHPAGAGILGLQPDCNTGIGTNPATATLLNRLNIRLNHNPNPATVGSHSISNSITTSPMRKTKSKHQHSEPNSITSVGGSTIGNDNGNGSGGKSIKFAPSLYPESTNPTNTSKTHTGTGIRTVTKAHFHGSNADFSDDLLDDVPVLEAGGMYMAGPGGLALHLNSASPTCDDDNMDNISTMSSITTGSQSHSNLHSGSHGLGQQQSRHVINSQAFPAPGGFGDISRDLNLHTSTGQPIQYQGQGQRSGIVGKNSQEAGGVVLTTSVGADTMFMGRELIGAVC